MKRRRIWARIALAGILALCAGVLPAAAEAEIAFADSVRLDELEGASEASVCAARTRRFEPSLVLEALAGDATAEYEGVSAFGVGYTLDRGDETGHLYVFDGGEAFGIANGVEGGFLLSYEYAWNVGSETDELTHDVRIFLTDDLRQRYPLRDLSFLSVEGAKEEAARLTRAVGLTDLALTDAFAVDAKQNATGVELYVFRFAQTIMGIPVNDTYRGIPEWRKDNQYIESWCTLVLSAKGVEHFEARYQYEVIEQGDPQPLLSAEEAWSRVEGTLTESLFGNPIRVEGASLLYYTYGYRPNDAELRPEWAFTLACYDQKDQQKRLWYRTYMVDAITGEVSLGELN